MGSQSTRRRIYRELHRDGLPTSNGDVPVKPQQKLRNGSQFEDFVADFLSGLLDILHLLAASRPSRLVSLFCLIDIHLNLSNQHL